MNYSLLFFTLLLFGLRQMRQLLIYRLWFDKKSVNAVAPAKAMAANKNASSHGSESITSKASFGEVNIKHSKNANIKKQMLNASENKIPSIK